MAYTYQDFENAVSKAGMTGGFSQYDLDLARKHPEAGMTLLSLKQDYRNATTDQQRALANTAANQIRASYGRYTGGTDGMQYYALDGSQAGAYSPTKYGTQIDDVLGKIGSFGSFSYDQAPTYNNAYAQLQQQMMSEIINRPEFSWSKEEDPAWSSYKKSYLREGDRATANALGQASAASGGRASSYAVNAATQAGDYYATRLNDVIPTLYQQAYDRYLNDYQMKLSDLNAVNTQEQLDYNRYLTGLSQFNTDRSQAYNEYLNNYNMLQTYLGNLQGQDDAEYSRYLNSVAQQLSERQYEDQRAQQELENRLALARLGGSYGDYTGLNELGITPNNANIYQAALASAGRVTPVGSGGTGGKTGSKASASAAGTAGGGKLTSFDYDGDEGIFTWNGKKYNSLKALETDLNAAISRGDITPAIEEGLKRKMAVYGINF